MHRTTCTMWSKSGKPCVCIKQFIKEIQLQKTLRSFEAFYIKKKFRQIPDAKIW